MARVQDNAGRDKVKKMVQELQGKQLSASAAATLEETWGAYRSTWPGWLDDVPETAADDEAARFKFKAGQLTYNCTTGD